MSRKLTNTSNTCAHLAGSTPGWGKSGKKCHIVPDRSSYHSASANVDAVRPLVDSPTELLARCRRNKKARKSRTNSSSSVVQTAAKRCKSMGCMPRGSSPGLRSSSKASKRLNATLPLARALMVPQESMTASHSSQIQRSSRLMLSRRGPWLALCASTVASCTLPVRVCSRP